MNLLQPYYIQMILSEATSLRSFVSLLRSRVNVISKDGATVICWHPKLDITFECTKVFLIFLLMPHLQPVIYDLESTKQPPSPLGVKFDHSKTATVQEIATALCKSERTLRPRLASFSQTISLALRRQERSFSPYTWDDDILQKRL